MAERPPSSPARTRGVVATGLGKRYGDLWAVRHLDLDVAPGHRPRPARPQRRRQDHRHPHAHHAVHADRGHGHRRRLTTSCATRPLVRSSIGVAAQQATVDGLLDARLNLELIGRLHGVPRAEARRRADRPARALRTRRRRRPPGQELLRRHAPAARPRRLPRRHADGPVPRRADDRPRSTQPRRPVADAARARRRRHHRHPHHAVPRGGRSPGRRHRGPRPRRHRRPRHARRAQGTDRRRPHRGHGDRRRPSSLRPRPCSARFTASDPDIEGEQLRVTASTSNEVRRWSTCSAPSTPTGSTSPTSTVARRRSTTSSSPSPAVEHRCIDRRHHDQEVAA